MGSAALPRALERCGTRPGPCGVGRLAWRLVRVDVMASIDLSLPTPVACDL
jgi:hypothetical protein